ncbi:Neuronal growth regulator 1 [Gryllus bimaculatus]|nr:Neuronal growth regulator 1 [Gryllus bimaculatus]
MTSGQCGRRARLRTAGGGRRWAGGGGGRRWRRGHERQRRAAVWRRARWRRAGGGGGGGGGSGRRGGRRAAGGRRRRRWWAAAAWRRGGGRGGGGGAGAGAGGRAAWRGRWRAAGGGSGPAVAGGGVFTGFGKASAGKGVFVRAVRAAICFGAQCGPRVLLVNSTRDSFRALQKMRCQRQGAQPPPLSPSSCAPSGDAFRHRPRQRPLPPPAQLRPFEDVLLSRFLSRGKKGFPFISRIRPLRPSPPLRSAPKSITQRPPASACAQTAVSAPSRHAPARNHTPLARRPRPGHACPGPRCPPAPPPPARPPCPAFPIPPCLALVSPDPLSGSAAVCRSSTATSARGASVGGVGVAAGAAPGAEFSAAPDQPAFATTGKTYRIVTKDTVVLPCEVTNAGNYVLVWKRGIAVLTAGSTKVSPDERLRLVDGYNLEIRDVATSDAGDYVCQIGTMEPKEITHTVEILVPPRIHQVTSNGELDVKKGATVTLECRASGNPVPTITWTRKVEFLLLSMPGVDTNSYHSSEEEMS